MGFRENLKDELTFQDIKVKELAERTGISKHTIDHYLATNGSQPQIEPAVKIARALNVSVEYLVTGERPATEPRDEITALTKKLQRLSATDLEIAKIVISRLEQKASP